MMTLLPFTTHELFEEFSRAHGSVNKHLLVLYSLAVGLNAQRVMELGTGSTTRALRAAMAVTGGRLISCDQDQRFLSMQVGAGPDFEFVHGSSDAFLRTVTGVFDLCLHDAAHDYWQLSRDLELIVPLMRRYGLIAIHDTQHSELNGEMAPALAGILRRHRLSGVHLPYAYGLTILRVEGNEQNPSVSAPWSNGRGAITVPMTIGTLSTGSTSMSQTRKMADYPRWIVRRLRRFPSVRALLSLLA